MPEAAQEALEVPPSPADIQRAAIASANGEQYDAKAQSVIEPKPADAATSATPASGEPAQETANSEAQSKADAQHVEGGGDEGTQGEQTGEEQAPPQPGKNHVARKIDKLTRENGELTRQFQALMQQNQQLLQHLHGNAAPNAQQPQPAQQPGQMRTAADPNDPQPDAAKYTDVSKFIADTAAWSARQQTREVLSQAARQQAQQFAMAQKAQEAQGIVKDFTAKVETGAKEIKDFAEVTSANADVEVANHVAHQLMTVVENPARILYHLAKNPGEVAKLNQMSPAKVAARLGAIEANASRPTPALSNAPAPGKPVAAKGSVGGYRDDMTQEEFNAWRAGKK